MQLDMPHHMVFQFIIEAGMTECNTARQGNVSYANRNISVSYATTNVVLPHLTLVLVDVRRMPRHSHHLWTTILLLGPLLASFPPANSGSSRATTSHVVSSYH